MKNKYDIYCLFLQSIYIVLGEPFNDEEFQDFMTIALDDEANHICTYKDFVQHLVVEDND